jgi:hypothetical protein
MAGPDNNAAKETAPALKARLKVFAREFSYMM